MIYLSIALVLIAIIFSFAPPSFNYTKTIVVKDNPLTPTQEQKKEIEDLSKLIQEEAPPTLDDLVADMNNILHDIVGDDQ